MTEIAKRLKKLDIFCIDGSEMHGMSLHFVHTIWFYNYILPKLALNLNLVDKKWLILYLV